MNPHKVDILIRGYHGQALTHACINSIIRNTQPELCRITYVDNGSDVPAFNHLVKSFPGMTFIRFPANYGSVTAINAGLALSLMSPAEYILLLDNDTEIPAGDVEWLPRWLSYFEDEQVGAAGATTNYVAGYQHTDVRKLWVFQKELCHAVAVAIGTPVYMINQRPSPFCNLPKMNE